MGCEMNTGSLMKRLRNVAAIAGGLVLAFTANLTAHEEDAVAKREMLSTHETIAEYQGMEYHTCRGRTSLCPQQCGHSGEFAIFKITKYVKYEKPGEYGDAKQETYRIHVTDFHRKPLDKQQAESLAKLKKGDKVLLNWRHDYVTDKNGSKYPERMVTKLQLMNAEG